jgi:hypothetical protein
LVQKLSTIKLYNLLVLVHGSEIWALRDNDKIRLTSFETKFFRKTAGYTPFDHKMHAEIMEELKAEPFDEEVRKKQNKLATTCNKSEQQQLGKYTTEL